MYVEINNQITMVKLGEQQLISLFITIVQLQYGARGIPSGIAQRWFERTRVEQEEE